MIWKPIEGVRVIGLGHKARQGKDTTADFLGRVYGASKFAFSDALYDVARVVYGMKEKDPKLLQILGTEIFRRMNENVWVDTLYYKILDKRPKIAVIPDCRFPNEVEMIKAVGGTLIKVSRINDDGSQFITTDRDPQHPSEIALDDYNEWDFQVQAKAARDLVVEIAGICDNFLRL